MSKILISCGGTGGHLAPGIAIGEALRANGHELAFIISEKKIDSKLIEKYSDFKFYKAPGCGFSLCPLHLIKFLYAQIKAVRFAFKILKSEKADMAISFGGFTSLGLAVAAVCNEKPLVLHEANRMPGKAIRLLGKFAQRVYVPFGVKISRRRLGIVHQAGYPIRKEIVKLNENESKKIFGFSESSNLLLVCGGSQGASVLNAWALENFKDLANEGVDMLCISGQGKNRETLIEAKDKNGAPRKFVSIEFCDNMAAAMSAAKIVVARAGAGSIAEFARCKTIPVLIPLPSSADNHQMENAKFIEKNGAGICISQDKISTLKNELLSLMNSPELCEKIKINLERIDEMNDTSKIAIDLENILNSYKKQK